MNRKYESEAREEAGHKASAAQNPVRLTELKKDNMSASARRNLRLASFDEGQEMTVRVRQHTLSPLDAVETCLECGRVLPHGKHEVCWQCEAEWRMPLPAMAGTEVAL